MWVLDTNTLIYFFKDQGRIAETLFQHAPKDVGIPAIVIFELQVRIAKSSSPKRRTQQLAELCSAIQVLPFNQKEAKAAADIRAKLEMQGTPIGPFDTLIAGTAMAHGAILISRNTREFQRIEGLQVENWYL